MKRPPGRLLVPDIDRLRFAPPPILRPILKRDDRRSKFIFSILLDLAGAEGGM